MVHIVELDVAQVVEHLPNKCEAQNSNSSTPKKKKRKEKNDAPKQKHL
jgi:hypothetical protein